MNKNYRLLNQWKVYIKMAPILGIIVFFATTIPKERSIIQEYHSSQKQNYHFRFHGQLPLMTGDEKTASIIFYFTVI